MVKLLFCLLTLISYSLVSGQDCQNEVCTVKETPIPIKTPSYPLPYQNVTNIKLLSIRVKPNANYAFGFQFTRFELAENDCLYFCLEDNPTNCTKNCGSVPLSMSAFYYDSSDLLFVYLVASSSRIPYPGIMGQVVRLDKSKQSYNDCIKDETVNLDATNGFYALMSDHFNYSNRFYSKGRASVDCNQRFTTTSTNIRVMVLTVSTNNTIKTMNLTGIPAKSDDEIAQPISSTRDTVYYYFKNEINFDFSFNPEDSYHYYIVIAPYNDSSPYKSCQNAGQVDMSQGKLVNFSALPNSSLTYLPNSDCQWVFGNPPKDHQLMILFTSIYTESADLVVVKTRAENSTMSGIEQNYLLMDLEKIELQFQSDPIEEFTQMNGQVAAINCTCPPSSIELKVNEEATITFGYNGKFPFCSGKTGDNRCVTNVTINGIAQINVSYSSGKNDRLSFVLPGNSVILNDVYRWNPFYYGTTWLAVIFEKETMEQHVSYGQGYTISFKNLPVKSQIVEIDLCVEELFEVRSDVLRGNFSTVEYHLSVEKCQGKSITGHFFNSTTGFVVNVYEGKGDNAKPVFPDFADSQTIFSSSIVSIRMIKVLLEQDSQTVLGFHALFIIDPSINVLTIESLNWGQQIDFSDKANQTFVFCQRSLVSGSGRAGFSGLYGFTFGNIARNQYNFLQIWQGASKKDADKVNRLTSQCDPNFQSTALPKFIFGECLTVYCTKNESTILEFNYAQQAFTEMFISYPDVAPGIVMPPKYMDTQNSATNFSYDISFSAYGQDVAVHFLHPIPKNAIVSISNRPGDHYETKTYTSNDDVCHLLLAGTELKIKYVWTCETLVDGISSSTACSPPILIQYEQNPNYTWTSRQPVTDATRFTVPRDVTNFHDPDGAASSSFYFIAIFLILRALFEIVD